jgi:hypothetical protein
MVISCNVSPATIRLERGGPEKSGYVTITKRLRLAGKRLRFCHGLGNAISA